MSTPLFWTRGGISRGREEVDVPPHPHHIHWKEVLEPVTDPLIRRCQEAFGLEEEEDRHAAAAPAASTSWWDRLLNYAAGLEPSSGLSSSTLQSDEIVFLPTTCLHFLEVLHAARPYHTLLAADFSGLPDVLLPGRNAPLVSGRAHGHHVDHDTLLVPWGTSDIFFPTDFDRLAKMYRHVNSKHEGSPEVEVSASHTTSGEFMSRMGRSKVFTLRQFTTTKSGYNPLLHDFHNTRVFCGSVRPKRVGWDQ